MSDLPRNGEVWWTDLAEIGTRPCVVLSRNATIPRLRRVMVAPCTTTIRGLDTEVELDPPSDPVPSTSVANLDSVESVNVTAFVERIGVLDGIKMSQICTALEVAVDCPR